MDKPTVVTFEDIQRQVNKTTDALQQVGQIVYDAMRKMVGPVLAAVAVYGPPEPWQPPRRRRTPPRAPHWRQRRKPANR
jgi:hypothetical protein